MVMMSDFQSDDEGSIPLCRFNMERCPRGLRSQSWKLVLPRGTVGSNPTLSVISGCSSVWLRTPDLGSGGRKFESCHSDYAIVTELEYELDSKSSAEMHVGSNPTNSTKGAVFSLCSRRCLPSGALWYFVPCIEAMFRSLNIAKRLMVFGKPWMI